MALMVYAKQVHPAVIIQDLFPVHVVYGTRRVDGSKRVHRHDYARIEDHVITENAFQCAAFPLIDLG